MAEDDKEEAKEESKETDLLWGKKWHEGGFEKNVIHFDKTAKVMRDIFDATQGFQKELGSRYSFLDIACAPGGFSRFLCSDPRSQRGWGISLPVTEGGFRLLFTWTHPDERKFQVKFRDMLTLEPEDCCEHQVDLVISDAQYLPLRKADQPGPDPALAKSQSVNPALGIWALLFQQLRLGLCNLRNGGVMMFRLNCKDGNVDWYFDCVCQVLAMVDRLFESMVLFKSGKSHQSDGTAYLICRGFCRVEFEAMQGAELLRKSIMVSRYEHEVAALGTAPIFRKVAPSREVRARARELFSLVDDAISRYKDQASFSYASTVKEWRSGRSVPSLRRKVRSNMDSLMPIVASRVAAQQLEKAALDVDLLSQQLGDAKDIKSLQAVLTASCQELVTKLRERAGEVQRIIAAATEPREDVEEDLPVIVSEDGWARSAEPEPAASEYLHVSGLLQGIEESTLRKCMARVGKVEEVRFLPQDQAMASRCSALVQMKTPEDAKAAREKLDGVIPEGTGFEMERNLMITFQVKNGIQVCDHLFVRNIPSAVQKHQIASLFNKYGQVLWCSLLPPRLGEEDRCALVQMASSDAAQNAIQALNWVTSSALMPAMMVRYAGPKVFAALKETEGVADEGSEEEEEDYMHYGVIEEAPKPAFQPLKEREKDAPSRWKKSEEEDYEVNPEGTRLWGWSMQPVKEQEEFPELNPQEKPEEPQPEVALGAESWEELAEPVPCEYLCMKDPPPGLPESVMQMWFKPYGHVLDLRPLDQESTEQCPAFLVQMSCVEEAINAVKALNGKSIMKGRPLLLSYWHGLVEASRVPINSSRLLQACRATMAQKEIEAKPQKYAPVASIDDAQLLDACRQALDKRKATAAAQARGQEAKSSVAPPDPEPEAPQASPVGDVEDWEDLSVEEEEEEVAEPNPCLCMTGVAPGCNEMVMQFWFRPYGQVRKLRALSPEEVGHEAPAFLVQMSTTEEAAAAIAALNGKPIMKGQPLVLQYWWPDE